MIRILSVIYTAAIFLLFLGVATTASAQTCPAVNDSPAFTAGGSVFGRIAAQWNSYFSSKADANYGVLCHPTIIPAPTSTGTQISFQPGLLTSAITPISAYYKFSRGSTVVNLTGSATSFSCTGNPAITLYECGTSVTCTSPVIIGTVTVTAAANAYAGTVNAPVITAGDYVAFAVSAGTCTSLDIQATAEVSTP